MDMGNVITGIRRLPMNLVEFQRHSWYFKLTKSHILSSKCTAPRPPGSSEECVLKEGEKDERCQFCFYSQSLDLPHLPDMVFNKNIFSLSNTGHGCSIEFNPFDALKLVSNGKLSVEVACSEEWKEYRNETGHTQKVFKPFDWTFSTDYKGTLKGDWQVEASEERINMDKLRRKDAILFFDEITLFEDELHDNGIAQLSIKTRVMPEVFYILLRYFMRVDNVVIKVNDTRFYHEFDKNYIIREYTSREAKIPELDVPPHLLLDPNEISSKLPLIKEENVKLSLPSKT